VVIPSHYHDDHTCGIPHLQKRHGVKLWALDSMVNILENPQEYNIPCLLPYPMKVDRSIGDGERVEWEEYSLKVVHFPGQTEYHMAMLVEVDGKRVVFTGDSVGEIDGKLVQPIIHRNIVTPENHFKCAKNLAELEPDFLAHGHGGWFTVDRKKVGTLVDRARRTEALFESLLPGPVALGVNPSWIRLVPYQSAVGAGQTTDIELEVHNYFDREIDVEAGLVLHEGWECSPELRSERVAAGRTVRLPFTIRVGPTPDRYGIAVDVTIDSKRIGQVTEGIVRVR
ncbi:MAG: MBL fold metallo-hydrolase, partial [Theionarchaea archaeon]|nr:MBL fold metallo-hydrolase [Theionarchaea archaeon]